MKLRELKTIAANPFGTPRSIAGRSVHRAIAAPQEPASETASAGEQAEIQRLKQLVAQLSSEVAK